LVFLGIGYFMLKGPDLAKYEALKTPRIVNLPDQKVLQIAVAGHPDKVLPKAFGVLFKTYYSLRGVPKGPGRAAPRLRMAVPRDMPKAEWEGYFKSEGWKGAIGVPVPDSVTEIVAPKGDTAFAVALTVWPYGDVAEILHVGPYDKETPTIEALEDYVKNQGYEIVGEHEEEYLRGPGMPGSKPENYYTIIRYRIKKIE